MIYQYYNLPTLFSEVCKTYKNNLAIQFSNQSFTYEQINVDSDKIAFLLLSQGLKRGDVIGIINSKEYLSYILMLACLKIGVIYTNIDPECPSERFKEIIKICGLTRIFSDCSISSNLTTAALYFGIKIENINSLIMDFVITKDLLTDTFQRIDGDAIAYIMFTSGSTGKPKGVAISHQNLLHFIQWGISYYKITPEDKLANVNPMFFDNSVFDFYVSLFSGACLVPISKTITSSPILLVNYIDQIGCTVWFSVPSLLIYLMTVHALQKQNFIKIRIITFGGEGYPKIELKKLYDLYSDRIRFINVYGPTECTCICSHYEITDDDFISLNGLPPLGYINGNFSFLVRNEEGEISNEGELCLLGPNVGRGYFNNPEATNDAFIEYTGYGFYKSRMYTTGDIVVLRDGLIYFVGRKDNQIKHMGYRIELEEIELAIGLIPEVNQVAVIYQQMTTAFGKIVAYVASKNPIDSKYIREKISIVLPSYMVPNKIILLSDLPKNQNGKVDRTKLRAEFF